jgi:hypothetical protein
MRALAPADRSRSYGDFESLRDDRGRPAADAVFPPPCQACRQDGGTDQAVSEVVEW